MGKIRLYFNSTAEVVRGNSFSLIMLTDRDRRYVITMVCDRSMAEAIELRAHHPEATKNQLPEVVAEMLRSNSLSQYEILIHGLSDGQYHTMVVDTTTLENYKIRASDAVLLSLVAGFPLYIEESLMRRQAVPFNPQSRGVSLPINTISYEMLEDSLQKAIEMEDYEMASKLRDEIKSRKNKDNE